LQEWGGWDVVKRVYANNWIFSPQTTMYSNIMNLKNWGGLEPPSPSLVYTLDAESRDVLHAEM